MRRIRDSLSKDDVTDIFNRAEHYQKKNVDSIGVLLSLQFAFYCGLKTGDLFPLKLQDVYDENWGVRSIMILRGREVIIPPDLKTSLEKNLTHLRAKEDYPTNKNAWLFPAKRSLFGKARSLIAQKRKLHRDVKEISEISNAHEKIRQAGIRDFFDRLPLRSKTELRIRETAIFAGCSVKWVEIVLANRNPGQREIVKAGPGDRKLLELRRQLSELEKLQIPPDELEKRVLNLLDQVKEVTPELISQDYLVLRAKKLLASRGMTLDVKHPNQSTKSHRFQ